MFCQFNTLCRFYSIFCRLLSVLFHFLSVIVGYIIFLSVCVGFSGFASVFPPGSLVFPRVRSLVAGSAGLVWFLAFWFSSVSRVNHEYHHPMANFLLFWEDAPMLGSEVPDSCMSGCVAGLFVCGLVCCPSVCLSVFLFVCLSVLRLSYACRPRTNVRYQVLVGL